MEMGDPLGKPPEVGGAPYLEALGKLGYNVETMSSSIPMYTKAAQAATSLMDTAYQQRLEWDKAQAANKEAIAHANQYQSEADFNNKASDIRIKALQQDAEQRGLDLDYARYTQKGKEHAFDLQQQVLDHNADIDNATFQGRKDLATEQNKNQLSEVTQQYNDRTAAQSDYQPALNELHSIPLTATDYENQFSNWYTKHLNTINNSATSAKIAAEVQNVMQNRNRLQSVQQQSANVTEIKRLIAGKHLPANDNYDGSPGNPGIYQDPKKMQQALVQGHVSEAVDDLNSLYTSLRSIGGTLPGQYRKDFDEMLGVRDRLIKTQNLDGYMDLVNGGNGNGDILMPDGTLRKGVQTDIAELKRYVELEAERQGKLKASTATVTTGKPGSLGAEVTAKDVPLTAVQQYLAGLGLGGTGTEAGGTGTPQQQQQEQALRTLTPEFATAHPEIRALVDAYKDDPSDKNKAALAEAVIRAQQAGGPTRVYHRGGLVGYQSGGEVGAESVGDPATTSATPFLSGTQFTTGTQFGKGFLGDSGSTDTVPAVLTPGEFVLNKNATEAIGPGNLAQINKIGEETNTAIGSPTEVLTPLAQNPLAADASVAAFGALAKPTDQIQHPDLIKDPQLAVAQARPTPESNTAAQGTLSTGRLPMSNRNNYAYPEGASDLNGIDRNVWANVMSEEGPQFSKDGKHMSVFGLWQDAPGLEGQAYGAVRAHGANSLPAFQAVTNAWDKLFLQKTKPQLLKSPGMQELVIADSQHAGGGPTLKIIQQMGGWDAINKMPATDAIRTYSSLRAHLWPGNSGRVDREREWALTHNSTLTGEQPTQVAGMQSGGMVEGNPLYGPGLGFQHGGMVPAGGGFESELEGGGEGKVGGGGGLESELDQPAGGAGAEGQRHRRFHPRGAAMGGMGAQPNIPDPMQKKLHKLSQDFIGGLSSLIKSKPELGGEIMRHAKNLIAQTGLSDVRTGQESPFGGGGAERQPQPMGMNPAMLAMSGMGGEQGSSSEDAYT